MRSLNTVTDRKAGRSSRWTNWCITIIIIIGAVLRLHHLQSRQFWGDEIHTYLVANVTGSLGELWNRCWTSGLMVDPPFYYILSHYSIPHELWHCEAAMRGLSVLFGTASVLLIYFIVRRLRGQCAACIAASILALSAFAIQYSQEHRPYSMLLFFSLLFYDALLRSSDRMSLRLWLYLVTASAGLIYTHYFGGFALAAAYLVWGVRMIVMYRRTGQGRFLLVLSALPVVLTILYLPAILNSGAFLHKMSIVVDPNGSSTQQMLNEWLISRHSPIGYAGEQLKAFASWRGGSVTIEWSVFGGILAVAGLLAGLKRSPWFALGMLFSLIIGFSLCIAFYEGLKFPFDPRRGIFLLPILILFVTDGVMLPVAVGTRIGRNWSYVIGIALSLSLFVTITVGQISNYLGYDSRGWRNEPAQADWRGMAKYIGTMARSGDFCAIPTPSERTWVRLHYAFYHELYAGSVPLVFPNSVAEIEQCLAEGTGLWFILAEPQNLPGEVLKYLLGYGTWKNFYGGSVLYIASSIPGVRRDSLVASQDEVAALAPARGTFAGDAVLSSTLRANLRFDASSTYSLMAFPRGPIDIDLRSAGDDTPCTFGLFKRIIPGEWQSALDFAELAPSSPLFQFRLRHGEPYLFLRHNGSAVYYFYLDSSGDYYLSLEAANDRPGPIRARVFFSEMGEAPRFVWARANNEFGVVRGKVSLSAGPRIMTVYYDSFDRLPNKSKDDPDAANSFKFTRWRLDKMRSATAAAASTSSTLATSSTVASSKWPISIGDFPGGPTSPTIYRSDVSVVPRQ